MKQMISKRNRIKRCPTCKGILHKSGTFCLDCGDTFNVSYEPLSYKAIERVKQAIEASIQADRKPNDSVITPTIRIKGMTWEEVAMRRNAD